MKDSMRREFFLSAVLLAFWTAVDHATPAFAQADSVCLSGGSDNSLRCDYSGMEECRMAASGGLGYCVSNPFASSANDSRAEVLQSDRLHHRSRLMR
jgi:hypothetical protein